MTKKSRQNLKYLEKEKSFLCKIKNHFSSFSKGFQLPKIVRPESEPLICCFNRCLSTCKNSLLLSLRLSTEKNPAI